MIAPAEQTTKRYLSRALPELAGAHIPAWRFTRRIWRITATVFGLLAVAVIIASATVRVSMTVDDTGSIEPASVWLVRPLETGIIVHIDARSGDSVAVGRVLARLDTTEALTSITSLQQQIQAAELDSEQLSRTAPLNHARLAAAVRDGNAGVMRARAELRQQMANFGVFGDADSVARSASVRVHVGLDIPSASLESAAAESASAVAQLAASDVSDGSDLRRKADQLRALKDQLIAARRKLARDRILAPASGIVLNDQLETLVGASVTSGQAVFEIADERGWRVVVNVSENDVHRVGLGDRVDVEIPALAALPNDRVVGHVTFVGWQPAATDAPTSDVFVSHATPGSSGVFRVVVDVNPATIDGTIREALRRGYVVHCRIVTSSDTPLQMLKEYLSEQIHRFSSDR